MHKSVYIIKVIELYTINGCELYVNSVVRKTRKAAGAGEQKQVTLGRRDLVFLL